MVVVSAIGLRAAPGLIERSLFRPHWLVPKREYATLITSGFVHADFMHLLFNGFTFYAFAFSLERRIGSTSFAMLYAAGTPILPLAGVAAAGRRRLRNTTMTTPMTITSRGPSQRIRVEAIRGGS